MKKLLTSGKIYISTSKIINNERGVFADQAIKKGELIERCPVIEVSKNDTANLVESILVTYFFYFGKNKEKLLVALGFGSIYNHSYDPNAIYKINSKEKIMDISAIRSINTGEEISINYNSANPKDKTPLWFHARK
jgi:SET domain-containing protein